MSISFTILGKNSGFRCFWFARALSLLGDGTATITLLLLVSASDNPGDVALLLLASSVPRFLGPLAGAFADRIELKRLLIAMELVQATVFAAIIVVRPTLPWLLLMVATSSTAATVFTCAARVVVPRLVDRTELMSANAWNGTALNLQSVGGPLLGGFLVPWIGTNGALGFNVVSFAVSALLLLRLPRLEPTRDARARPALLSDVGEGLRYTGRSAVATTVAGLLFAGVLFGSLDNVALILFARENLDAGPAGVGVLTASFGVAMVVATLWLSRPSVRRSPVTIMLGGWLLTGLGLAFTGLSPIMGLAIVAQFLGGLGNGVAMIGQETLLQQSVPTDKLGRVGGSLSSSTFLGTSLAYVLGAPLATLLAPAHVLLIAGSGLAITTVLWAPRAYRVVREVEHAQREPVPSR